MMTIDKAIRLAHQWAAGHVCTLREGEAQEYHQLCAEALERSRWIPVTERLPERNTDVLVVALWFEKWKVAMGWVMSDGSFTVKAGFADQKLPVSHWMPLPTPPKED